MKIGYARVSTIEQKAGYKAQLEELKQAGVDKIYKEQVSSVAKRDKLANALDFAREGDTFIVCKLDRLARSMKHLIYLVALLDKKEVTLKVLNIGLAQLPVEPGSR